MTSPGAPDAYAVDGLTPENVVKIASLDDLSAALSEANAAGSAVIPWGGGTRMSVGNVPERYTTALDLTGLSSNVIHEAGDLTLVADAGVTIAELGEILAKQGQRLPFDVPQPDRATVGGSVASNAAGQSRSSLGGIRDWIIGIKVVLADGTVTKSGGRVVKNVQGYDLHRLHTGAFGTLGVAAEVALKVIPIPAQQSTVSAWFSSIEDAGEYAMQVFNGPAMPEALTVFAGGAAVSRLEKLDTSVDAGEASALVLSSVSGGKRAVERRENDLTGLAGSTGANGYEVLRGDDGAGVWSEAESGEALRLRTTLKPRDAVKLLAKTLNGGSPEQASGELQAGFGTVTIDLASKDVQSVAAIRESARGYGGEVVVERCPADMKSEIDVFGDLGDALSVMKSIKQRFDPNRVLNPGRFASRI